MKRSVGIFLVLVVGIFLFSLNFGSAHAYCGCPEGNSACYCGDFTTISTSSCSNGINLTNGTDYTAYCTGTNGTTCAHSSTSFFNRAAGSCTSSCGVSQDSQFVWVPNNYNNDMWQLNYSTGALINKSAIGYVMSCGQAQPHNVLVDRNNNSWVTGGACTLVKPANGGWFQNKIIKFTPQITGNVSRTEYSSVEVPASLALDKSNNIWVIGYGGNLSKHNFATGNGEISLSKDISTYGHYLVIDSEDNLWVSITNNSDYKIIKYDSNLNILRQINASTSSVLGGDYANNLVIDKQDNLWAAFHTAKKIIKFSKEGVVLGTYNIEDPTTMAVDLNNNIWVTQYGSNVTKLSNEGIVLGQYSLYSGLYIAWGVSVDSENNVWVTGYASHSTGFITKLYNNGTVIHVYPVGWGPAVSGDMTGTSITHIVRGACNLNETLPLDANIITPKVCTNWSTNTVLNFTQNSTDKDDFLRITWDFGDGSNFITENYKRLLNLTKADTTHSYISSGWKNLRLTASEMGSDRSDFDSVNLLILKPGINVVPVITNPPLGFNANAMQLIMFNASNTYVVNCTNGTMPLANFTTCDGMNCSYVHAPGARIGMNLTGYTLFFNWSLGDGRFCDGNPNTNCGGNWSASNNASFFSQVYQFAGRKNINLKVTYNKTS